MAEKVQGVIQYLNEREGKYGKSYNVRIDGELYFLQGKYPPRGIEQGDMVELEWNYKGNYKIVEKGSLRKIEGGATPPPSSRNSSAPQRVSAFDDRQDVISKQAALNTALAFLEFAHKAEKLPVPAAKNQGFGYLRTLWMEEAAKLYELNTGKVWEMPEEDIEEEAPKPVRKRAAKKAPKPEPEPEEAPWEGEFEDDELPEWD